jgi:predicted ferric reductase
MSWLCQWAERQTNDVAVVCLLLKMMMPKLRLGFLEELLASVHRTVVHRFLSWSIVLLLSPHRVVLGALLHHERVLSALLCSHLQRLHLPVHALRLGLPTAQQHRVVVAEVVTLSHFVVCYS